MVRIALLVVCVVILLASSGLWITSYWKGWTFEVDADKYAIVGRGALRIIWRGLPPRRLYVGLWWPTLASGLATVAAVVLVWRQRKLRTRKLAAFPLEVGRA
jgi:hypothetical protein